MKRCYRAAAVLLLLLLLQLPVAGQSPLSESGADEMFNIESQLDALGKAELMQSVPDEARELLEQADLYDLSVRSLLELSPQAFLQTVWQIALQQIKKPIRTLGVILAVVILCALLGGLQTATAESAMTQIFTTVAVLCVLTSVVVPILDCIIRTSAAVKDSSTFMLTFIPVFAAALTAAGRPVTGAVYNMFLFTTCQVVAQVVAQTLVPLMGIYLALCVVGALVPELRISSAVSTIKTIVSWALGLIVTVFVGLLSVQTMVAGGADSVTARTAKFLIGSFVPVVGNALSDAFTAAQGCLRLIKTTVGAYGIVVALFIFLPVLFHTILWYLVTGAAAVIGDVMGVEKVSGIMKSCSAVLGILVAVVICFALLIIVSIAVVMVTAYGG